MELIKKHLVIFISLLFIVVSLFFYLFHLDKMEVLDSEYERLTKTRSGMLLNLKNGDTFEEDISTLQGLLENIDSRLFDHKELAANYNYFFQIESQTNVKLSDLSQFNLEESANKSKKGKKNEEKLYSSLKYELGVAGTFAQLLDFLRNLEGGSAFFRLDRISISPIKSIEEEEDEIQAKLSFMILAIKEK